MSLKRKKTIPRVLILIITFILILINLYPIEWLGISWWNNTHYQHGGICLLALLSLAYYKHRNSFFSEEKEYEIRLYVPIALLIVISSILAEFYWHAPLIGAYSLWSWILFLLWRNTKLNEGELFSIGCVLFFITPLPSIYQLTSYFQVTTSVAAAKTLYLLGFETNVSHGRIIMDSGTFIVGPASSGIRSFLVLPTLSVVLLFWESTSISRGFLFILLITILSQIFNLIRVMTMLVTAYFMDPQFAYGLFHDTGNTIVFIIALTTMVLVYFKLCRK